MDKQQIMIYENSSKTSANFWIKPDDIKHTFYAILIFIGALSYVRKAKM